jgi:diguanylate cyclase (GGDEF)-like protein
VLREIARAIKSQIRSRDHVFRYGGEEFCVILAESDEHVAHEVGVRICDCVRSMKPGFLKNCPTKLTISVGVSTAQHWSGQGVIDELIEQADQALYEAKRTGRDRIVCYNEMQKAGASPK